MKQTWHDHFVFRSEAGAAKILIHSLLSRDNGWSSSLTGKDSIRRGDR